MVAIAPFRALRYAPELDLAAVTTPPHDCRPEGGWSPFLEEPHSIAHVVLARREGGDAVEEAARRLDMWQKTGVLVRDQRPGLYLYEILWGPATARRRMRGLLCRLALDPAYEEVRRHEAILPARKAERYELRKAVDMDPEPIWLLYRDERGWVDEVLWSNAHEELSSFEDEDGSVHTLWRVEREEAVGEVVAQFEDRTLVIADGHHRYQTALDHWQHTGRDHDGSILVCLSRDTDPGIGLVATHRLLHLEGKSLPEILDDLPAGCRVQPLAPDAVRASVAGLDADTVLLVGRGADGPAAARVHLPTPGSSARREALTVQRVHTQILEPLGVDPADPSGHVSFTRSITEALAAVDTETADVAVLLAPEDISAVLEVARDGDVMPQKSTYFVPKLRSGLVLSPLDEPRPTPWTDQAQDPGAPDFRMPPV